MYMNNDFDKNGIQELSFNEINEVNGAVGVPGAAIGGVVGGLLGGYTYIAAQAGSSNGTGASAGGALTAILGGAAAGAITGATGSYAVGVAGAALSIPVAYVSGRLDAQNAENKKGKVTVGG